MRWNERKSENVPWYRQSSYKGTLTEAEKRYLDSFRSKQRHPAARYNHLPDEVQSYISALEIEAYDSKMDATLGRSILYSAIGAAFLYLNHYGFNPSSSPLILSGSLFFLIVPWLIYAVEYRRNANEFLPSNEDSPHSTNERIKMEWELDEIARLKRAEGDNSD